MKIRYLLSFLLIAVIMLGCGQSYDEKKKETYEKHEKLREEDSLAFKIGVTPTLDCLPIYVAKDNNMFDSLKADIRLKIFSSQIDCDAALKKGQIEGCVTDVVRGQYIKKQGMQLKYIASTNAYWQLITNRLARIRRLNQLNDKMIAMARYSATALLADFATDSAKLKEENVFKIQINDVDLRLLMLLNNEMDAMLLPEPQATTARLYKHPVLLDSRNKDMRFGVIALNEKKIKDKNRQQQMEVFIKGYNDACDSINKNGLKHYAATIKKYYKIDNKTFEALPKLKYEHAKAPRQKDIDTADKWLK